MSFIKKNYEKVLLGAVLLGLVGCLLALPVVIQHDKDQLMQLENSIVNTPPKPLPLLDMSNEDAALQRVQSPYNLDFETTNRLFNPVQWQKRQDGGWIKIASENDIGPGAVKVTNIQPLYYIMRLDRVEPANQFSAARYVIGIEEQNAQEPFQRRPHQHYLSVGEKDEALSLISASGPANASQLTLQILSSGETVTLGQNKPYQEVDGYAAGMAYPPDPPEAKTWKDLRVGADLKISGKDYKVVVIDPNEVVISAESNQKKTTLPYQP
jgi:hypothetical protein